MVGFLRNAAGAGRSDNAFFTQEFLQFSRFEHFGGDVAAADEFAFDIKLRNGRPVGILLDALTDGKILENIHGLEGNLEMLENGGNLAGKPSHGKFRGSLHEENDVVALDFVVNGFQDVGHDAKSLWEER
jgi:hypothetical protein